MAFTSYSKVDDHLVLFDWVGIKNFLDIVNFNSTIGKTFWSVLGWTIVWAIFATFLNYIFGVILAMIINRKDTKIKGFRRFILMLTIAVPQFVSLLVVNTMIGSGKMILSNKDKSLEELITAVCSKGGTTIEAMKVFNDKDFAGVIDDAVTACIKRAGELENL